MNSLALPSSLSYVDLTSDGRRYCRRPGTAVNRCRRQVHYRPPDLDTEGVGIVIIGRDHELVAALSIDRAFTLELGLVTSHHQPFVAAAVEVQVTRLELELGVAVGHIGALLVLGDEAEVGFAVRFSSAL